MSAFWDSVIRPLLVALAARVAVEVGVARGETTMKLLEYGAEHGCVIHGVDPAPRPRLRLPELQAQYGDSFVFHKASSLDALFEIRDADLVMIDGDHNWYSVYNELKILATVAAEEKRPFPVTVLHDVDWPYGRRDMYFDPEAIPQEFRQEWAWGGLLPGVQEPVGERGLNITAKNAIVEGTPHNGIRTAVEDFLAQTDLRLEWSSVPGFFGMGIVVDQALLEGTPDLRTAIEWLRSAEFMEQQARRLEENRLALMIELNEARLELSQLREAG
jgi:O-antigen biosynthesis protein